MLCSAMLVMSESRARELGSETRARIPLNGVVGCDPNYVTGRSAATPKSWKKRDSSASISMCLR